MAVVDLLGRQDCCLTAHEIAERLRGEERPVGIASVYRALELLDQLRLVQKLDTGEGVSRYEPVQPGGGHHHHVVCEACGQVAAFEDHPLEQAIARLSSRLDYAVDAHDVVLRGTCPGCRAPAGT